MSGIAGFYNLDGRPADLALLRRMSASIAHRGPDGVGQWLEGPVGLSHRMLHTTPESRAEKQPLLHEAGNLCLVMDGRVDNRDELKTALQSRGLTLRSDSDAEIVLRAYECWGEMCPLRILGDFAFAVWDRAKRQLFCARDVFGMKPFYYYCDGRRFLFGSELRPLFEDVTVAPAPNEAMIGEYLANAITDREETLYRGIFRLPPAHFLSVRPGQVRKARYWNFDPAHEIRYRTDAEYAEHFLVLLKEAVRCRLRSYTPIGALLSGGLDSSSIVGVVQALSGEGQFDGGDFETFSLIFPGLLCDESDYIQDVVRTWGIKHNAVDARGLDALGPVQQVCHHRDFPDYPNGFMADPLQSLAREKGFRILLTGIGGDEWLTGSRYQYADLLRQWKILPLIRQARFNAGVSAFTLPSFSILKFGLWPLLRPLLPPVVRRALRWMRRRDDVPSWVGAPLARRIRLVERLRREPAGPRFASLAQQALYQTSAGGWMNHFYEMEERRTARFGFEHRHPFTDRRIAEFSLALPEDQRWRQDQPKFILRQSMQHLLPERVRRRRGKAEFSHVFAEALYAHGGDHLFESLTIASMGWVDGERVRGMYQQMARLYAQGNDEYADYAFPLWMIFGIEVWFKTVFQGLKPPDGLPAGKACISLA